jgi:hypothetical protein
LRNWLSFYGDGFTEDEYSPVAYWDRSIWQAGLYMPRVPRLERLQLRAEGEYSDNPLGGQYDQGYFYWNLTWRNGYTSDGNIMGNWVGRQGKGGQAWATYAIGARNTVALNFRHQNVSDKMLPGGGTLTDVGITSDFYVHGGFSAATSLVYEKLRFPVLSESPRTPVIVTVQLGYWPAHRSK